jgi:hypothetical protein
VGDYGSINKESGSFEKEGNIYDSTFAPELNIATEYPTVPCDPEDELVIVTKGGKNAEANAEVFGCAMMSRIPQALTNSVLFICVEMLVRECISQGSLEVPQGSRSRPHHDQARLH